MKNLWLKSNHLCLYLKSNHCLQYIIRFWPWRYSVKYFKWGETLDKLTQFSHCHSLYWALKNQLNVFPLCKLLIRLGTTKFMVIIITDIFTITFCIQAHSLHFSQYMVSWHLYNTAHETDNLCGGWKLWFLWGVSYESCHLWCWYPVLEGKINDREL